MGRPGIEPGILAEADFKSAAYACFATGPYVAVSALVSTTGSGIGREFCERIFESLLRIGKYYSKGEPEIQKHESASLSAMVR